MTDAKNDLQMYIRAIIIGKVASVPNLPKYPEYAFYAFKMLRNSPKLNLGFVRSFTCQLHGDVL